MFEVEGTKSLDSNAITFVKKGINFVGRTFENNGIQGKIDKRDFEPNNPYTITATVIGNYKYVKYQKEPYYCSQNINKLTPKTIFERWNEKNAYFIIASIQRFVSQYDGQQGGYKLEDIKNHIIELPLKNNKIDFEFMETFVAELEAQRVAELENYLEVSGLDDYELSNRELEVLKSYDSVEWGEYRIGDLFEKVKVKPLRYKTSELKKIPDEVYKLPALTAGIENQGLNNYVPMENATILQNVISISANGANTGVTFFQSNKFTVLQDAYAIDWKDPSIEFNRNNGVFISSVINGVLHGKYEWTNKAGWLRVQDEKIYLPNKNGKIDFDFMETYISAITKLAIKDVVKYADKRIAATKKNC